MPKKGAELQLDQDAAFQKREWTVQHAGWWALTAFVLMAAAGAFGGGPLSRAYVGDPSSLSVDYDRFVRVGAPTRLSIQLGQAAASHGAERELRINREYFDALKIDHVNPEPSRLVVQGDQVVLSFTAIDGRATEAVTLDAEPLAFGRRTARVGIDGSVPLAFTQFAYF